MLKYSLGIDISMKTFYVCLSVIDTEQTVKVKGSRSFANSTSGFEQLDTWVNSKYKNKEIPLQVIMEATGVYYEGCAMYLFEHGYKVAVVLPNKAKKYLESSGHKSKNDKIDAEGLAQMGAEKKMELWQPLHDFYFTLRSFTRHHESLQEVKTNISNQLHAHKSAKETVQFVVDQLEQLIDMIENQIEEATKKVQSHIASDAAVMQKVNGICKIKGVGLLTVATLLAETNGFLLFKNAAQLVSYAGYDVIENQSGKHVGKTRISKKGNTHIRRILYMPAINVIRYQVSPFDQLFTRTLSRHFIKMKSYVAIQKKLLTIIYALWKKEEAYDAAYMKTQSTREEEVVLPSGHNFEEVDGDKLKSSPSLSQDYTRCTTIELSAFVPSGQIKNKSKNICL